MTELFLFRAGRALVVTLSALTLAHLLDLSHRLAYDQRLWAQVTGPDALYGYFVIGGPLEVAAVAGVTALAVRLGYQRLAGRLALTAAVLHSAALGVWLGVVLPANVGIDGWSTGGNPSDMERWRAHWEMGHAVSFGLLLLGFGALVLAVLSERHPPQWGQQLSANPVPIRPLTS